MGSKLTTKDIGEAAEGLDLLPLGLLRRHHFHHRYRVAVLNDDDGSHHGFVVHSRTGLCRVLSVDKIFEVRVCIHGGCSDKEYEPDS